MTVCHSHRNSHTHAWLLLLATLSAVGALWAVISTVAHSEMLASSLPVEIRGVITSSDPRASVALLQDIDRGKLIAVKPGYFIFDKQAKVVSIPSAKTVIIDRGNNQLEYLGAKPAAESPSTAQPATVNQ